MNPVRGMAAPGNLVHVPKNPSTTRPVIANVPLNALGAVYAYNLGSVANSLSVVKNTRA
jgi:hypothetical protein